VIGSIWREKFKEMVDENAELQMRLSLLEKQMSCSVIRMQQTVTKLNTELASLKCSVDDNACGLPDDVHSLLKGDSSSSTNVFSRCCTEVSCS